MSRRKNRGEQVSEKVALDSFKAFIERGAGELFQAFHEETILSSVLILKAENGGYYHSAGNTPKGMNLGASQFLIKDIANVLKEQSIQVFNLGGSDRSNPGLSRFKAGFGARAVELEEASFFLCSRTRLRLIAYFQQLSSKYQHLFKKG